MHGRSASNGRPALRLVAAPELAPAPPSVLFCSHCGTRPFVSDNAATSPGSRVCGECGLGLILEAAQDVAPHAGDAFLVLDRALSVCAVSAGRRAAARDQRARRRQPAHDQPVDARGRRGRAAANAGGRGRLGRARRRRHPHARPSARLTRSGFASPPGLQAADRRERRWWCSSRPDGPHGAIRTAPARALCKRQPALCKLPANSRFCASLQVCLRHLQCAAPTSITHRDERNSHERRGGHARRQPQHPAQLGAPLWLPAPPSDARRPPAVRTERDRVAPSRRSRKLTMSRARSHSRANAARDRRRARAWPPRSPRSTRTRQTACSRRASRCGRSSERSRRCCSRAIAAHADEAASGSTPEYEFGWRYATAWLSALKRLCPAGDALGGRARARRLGAARARRAVRAVARADAEARRRSHPVAVDRDQPDPPGPGAARARSPGGRARGPRHLARRARPARLLGPLGRAARRDLRLSAAPCPTPEPARSAASARRR